MTGVLFTRDPVTGSPCQMVVNASYGLGEVSNASYGLGEVSNASYGLGEVSNASYGLGEVSSVLINLKNKKKNPNNYNKTTNCLLPHQKIKK